MFNKLSSSLYVAVLVLITATSPARAIDVNVIENVNSGFTGNWNHDSDSGPIGGINDTYQFNATSDVNLKFFTSVNHDQGDPGALNDFGISNLVMTWSAGDVVHVLTNAFGVVDHASIPFFHQLTGGTSGTLTVTGDFLSGGGGYSLSVAAVPLPPAAIAFASAMIGVGFLARRKKKQKTVFS